MALLIIIFQLKGIYPQRHMFATMITNVLLDYADISKNPLAASN